MSWEERFFGTAPAALTAQVEGRGVKTRFPALSAGHDKIFGAEDMRVLDFRFLHGVAGPDGPGLLLSFTIRGETPPGSFAVFTPQFGQDDVQSNLPNFAGDHDAILIANDIYGSDRNWLTKVFLPFAAVKEVEADRMHCLFEIYDENGKPLIEFSKEIPWPDPAFRDAMNAMSFAVHLLVSLMKASGRLTPLDIQAIRRDLQKRHALSQVGLDILKRYLKSANNDPSSAQELGLLAREATIFAPADHEDILKNLVRFAKISGELSPEQERYINEFAKHAGFTHRFEHEEHETYQSTVPQAADSKLDAAYRCLGVQPTTTAKELKQRYRHLVLEVHPDRLQHASEHIQRLANERLAEINQAYELIQKNLARF